MNAPNVVSVAVIVGIIALCQGLAETIPALGEPWVPVAVLLLSGIAKALQVYLEAQRGTVTTMRSANGGKLRQWLLG